MNDMIRERTYVSYDGKALGNIDHSPASGGSGRMTRTAAVPRSGKAQEKPSDIASVKASDKVPGMPFGTVSRLLALPLRHAVGAFLAGTTDKAHPVEAERTHEVTPDAVRDELRPTWRRIDPVDVTIIPAAVRDARQGGAGGTIRTHADRHAGTASAAARTRHKDGERSSRAIDVVQEGFIPAFAWGARDAHATRPADIEIIPAAVRDASLGKGKGLGKAGRTHVACRFRAGLTLDKAQLKALVDVVDTIEDCVCVLEMGSCDGRATSAAGATDAMGVRNKGTHAMPEWPTRSAN